MSAEKSRFPLSADRATSPYWPALLWWLGSPFILVLITWGPYWARNLALGRSDWLRVPLVGDAVFDVAAYLQPVGQAMLGLDAAKLLGPFTYLVRALSATFPGASVAEVWLITRWLSAVAAVWVGAWAIRRWTDLDKNWAQFFSATLWISLALVLGMKPGVFSWFPPLGLFGFGVVPIVAELLERRRIWRAAVWTIAALALTSVYAWYLIFIALLLGVIWFRWFAKQDARLAAAMYAFCSIAGVAASYIAARWIAFTPQGAIFWELYHRLSLSATHMIFISGSVLLTALWIPAVFALLRLAPGEDAQQRLDLALTAWITLLFAFFHSPFTGEYIQNDHFRASAVVLSWFTLALVWKITSETRTRSADRRPARIATRSVTGGPQTADRLPALPVRQAGGRHGAATFVTLLISAFFVLKILFAPYAWNRDLLNDLQLTHWFALLLASWLALRQLKDQPTLTPRIFLLILLGGSLVIGGVAWVFTLTREFSGLSRVEKISPVINWIKTNVPPQDPVCADHGGDGFSLDDQLGAATGRVVHFAHSTLYLRELDMAYLNRMRTVAGFYDVKGAGDESFWQLQSSLNQFIVCAQYPWQTKLFRALGLPETKIDALIGCPRKTIDARWAYVKDAIDRPRPDADEFRRICPYVVVPDDKKVYWKLPPDYRETRVMDGISIFAAASTETR